MQFYFCPRCKFRMKAINHLCPTCGYKMPRPDNANQSTKDGGSENTQHSQTHGFWSKLVKWEFESQTNEKSDPTQEKPALG